MHRYKYLIVSLLILLSYLFLYFLVNPFLMFHHQQLGFMWGGHFLKSYINFPGGIAELASIFLFQLSAYRWSGSLVYLLSLIAIFLLLRAFLADKTNFKGLLLAGLPVVFLGFLITDYTFPFYYLTVLIIGLLLLNAFRFIAKYNNILLTLAAVLVLVPLMYYIIGGGAFLIFILAVIIQEFIKNTRKPIAAIFLVLLAVLVPYIAAHCLFFVRLSDAYFNIKPHAGEYLVWPVIWFFYLLVPIAVMLQAVIDKLNIKVQPKARFFEIHYTLIVLLTVAAWFLFHHPEKKHKIEINWLASEQKWDELLQKVDKRYSEDRMVVFYTNKALYFTGQMPDKLFDYPQPWGVDGLLVNRYYVREELLPTAVLFMEMGYLNEAIHWANEAISQNEYSPRIIEQLIIMHIIDENYSSAMLYVNMLKKFPFFKNKAKHYEQMIDNVQPEKWMIAIREFRPYTNFRVNMTELNNDLLSLLLDHPNNKIVYEYLMAYYLLNNDFERFHQHVGKGAAFNYGGIPKSFQQAMVHIVAEMRNRGQQVQLIGIDSEVVDHFIEYQNILGIFNGNKQEAKPVMDDYKHTYWYYLDYVSPVTLNLKISIE